MATIAPESTTEQDTSLHDRRLKRRLEEDAEFREEFERSERELAAIDALMNTIDDMREERGLSKAALARTIGKDPASVRRLLTAHGNPNLRTIVAAANAIGADVRIVPRKQSSGRKTANKTQATGRTTAATKTQATGRKTKAIKAQATRKTKRTKTQAAPQAVTAKSEREAALA